MQPRPQDIEGLGDAALVARIAAGDERALMAAYDRHGDAVFGVAVRFLSDREAAAEIAQEVFLTLWRRAARFDVAAGSLLAWLFGITRHRALDRLRLESRRPRLVGAGDRDSLSDDERLGRAVHAGHGAGRGEDAEGMEGAGDPALEIDRRWAGSVVRGALSEMPDWQRQVLVLAYDHGLTQVEIAGRLGVPLGTVKSRTRRGLAALRERLVGIPGLLEP